MKATEKGLFCYQVEDGRTALTSKNLAYATNAGGFLVLASVREDDAKTLNIIADPLIGFLVAELYGKKSLDPEAVIAMDEQARKDLSHYHHCAILAQGTLYVRDGDYVPLNRYIKTASHQDLAATLQDVAFQAALMQLSAIAEDFNKLHTAV